MKRFCRLFIFLIVLSGWIPNIAAAQVVDMPDPTLATLVRAELNLVPDAPITRQALQRLTRLSGGSHADEIRQFIDEKGAIKDLTGLEHAPNLLRLSLVYHDISDLGPLKGLTRLEDLALSYNEISDLGPLARLTQLRDLIIVGNPINDFRPLTGLKQLEDLSVPVRSMAVMSNLRSHVDLAQLEILSVHSDGNQIGDLQPFANLTQLRRLILIDAQINDITPLANLTQLAGLNLSENQIRDATPLTGLKQLDTLLLHNNQIRDVTPFANLTQLWSLTLGGNQIRDVTPLAGLKQLTYLDLRNNQIRDVTPIQHLIDSASTRVLLEGNPIGGSSDLVIENFLAPNIQSISLGPNGKRNLSLTVKNQGTAESKTTTLKFYRSTDKNISPTDDTELKAFRIEALPEDDTAEVSFSIIGDKTPSTYYYGACVDSVDNEEKTDNNCTAALEIKMRGLKLDLVVESVKATHFDSTKAKRFASPGQLFELRATVQNQGTEKSEATHVKFYRSTDEDISPTDDTLLEESSLRKALSVDNTTITALSPDSTAETSLRVLAPKKAGTYYYGACVVGSEGEVNCSTEPAKLTVTVPDLQIQSIEVAKTGTSIDSPKGWTNTLDRNVGEPFDLRVTVSNTGNRVAPKTKVIYYRSSDAEISEDDEVVGSVENEKLLSPQDKPRTHIATFQLPEALGTYYYGAKVESVQYENNIKNNWSVGVRVEVGVIKQLELPSNLISDVAFGKNKTYFVLNPQFPTLVGVEDVENYISYKCIIKLGLGKDNVDLFTPLDLDAFPYYMFPLKTPQEEVEELIDDIENAIIFEMAGYIPIIGGFIGKFKTLLNFFVRYKNLENKADDPTVTILNFNDENIVVKGDTYPVLFMVPEQLSNVDIDVELQYYERGQWIPIDSDLEDEAGDIIQKIGAKIIDRGIEAFFNKVLVRTPPGKAFYQNSWNLEETFQENPGLAAAPRAQPMSLTDYPPFQQLSPEMQEYLLQYFDKFANAEVAHGKVWQVPDQTSLLSNYPNPFNPETWIPYHLAEAADVRLTLYDIHGRVVRDLDLGHQRAGMYHGRSRAVHWDGKNAFGEPVASGIYFYTLKAGDFTATRKMLIRK